MVSPETVRELRNLIERALLQTAREAKWLEMDPQRLRPAQARLPEESNSAAHLPPERALNRIEEQEYSLIRKTLLEEKGFIRRAARNLGMSHQALLRRLTKWPELRYH